MSTSPHPRRQPERPRDALGRPLTPGATGVMPLDLPAALPPAATLAAAQHLFDTGHPFQAHEVLEAAWKAAGDDDRALWRSLTQLAVGLTHLARGNVPGGVTVLARAAEGLGPYVGRGPHGVDADGLVRWCEQTARAAVDGSLAAATRDGGAGSGDRPSATEIDSSAATVALRPPRLVR
ncbi:DUF309 domain-containing protein [Frankia sp. AiPs1]|uniref:DUF309 domain-containing protein n=1 Tax=Frankia sp. AiPa1 TaxID=573492 RepID=UPI00202B626E|nr:DUF309 domain-containing protein [Frankia sp. AiPa1]MCL9760623.1 DUF309 domain-containing protein [Frankia sp. AiPa1]